MGAPTICPIVSRDYSAIIRLIERIDIKREFVTVPLSIPIRELKNTGKVSDLCLGTQKPISIIRNGYEVMVIMSIETYERRIAQV